MQKFPKDTHDFIEKMYCGKILGLFPSYGEFWEKFIGVDNSKLPLLYPRSPKFPQNYQKKEKFINTQMWMARASYGVFCNLAGAYFQLERYKENIPITTEKKFFEAIEAIECGYHHLGAVILGLETLWGKIRKFAGASKKLGKYLEGKGKYNNCSILNKEPRFIRNELVHFGRHVFDYRLQRLYLPLKLPYKKNYTWPEAKVDSWIPADTKLEEHVNIACKTCEDVYRELIAIFSNYTKKEGIKI